MDITDNLTATEIELFAKSLSESARDGHFVDMFSNKSLSLKYLNEVSTRGLVPEYGNAKGLLFAFKENNECVCFALVCTSIIPLADAELLFFVVPKIHRNKGNAKKSMRLLLSELKGSSLIARCMPKSTFMIDLLVKTGFSKINLGKSKNINLIYKNG